MGRFKFFIQSDKMDCGPTCLRMISSYYGKNVSLSRIRHFSETTREGSSLSGISKAAEAIGLHSIGVKIDFEKLYKEAPLPCIVYWKNNHFVVVYKIRRGTVYVADPGYGLLKYKTEEFLLHWIGKNATTTTKEGITLLLQPTSEFNKESDDIEEKRGFSFLYKYLFRYKRFIFQLVLGLFAASLLQLAFPFLTQSIVDVGIQNQDIGFVYLILIAQLFLFLGKIGLELIRNWIMLHLSTRINISLVSDFFIKLMNLPISYFDTKMTGDIMQRVIDHKRIENLLTNTSLNILFSLLNLIIFGAVLAWYNTTIFILFFSGSSLYVIWVLLFMEKRKVLDFKRFSLMSEGQSKTIELINGMQEIKLHNAERQKRWGWEYIQARLFRVEIKSMALEQSQSIGSGFINELKNILITVLSAKLVIEGEITLGMMLSISYILGQLNGPILQLVNFLHSIQDAKLSLERLSEIHNRENEEVKAEEKLRYIPENGSINIESVTFRYPGASSPTIQSLSLEIPYKKTTAIVGASGSGKTTLVKLLMKFYEDYSGSIRVGNLHLKSISQNTWRENSGTVMQEGYIFNDTIANNIAVGHNDGNIDREKLFKAVDLANIKEFIESLPLAYNTKIGMEGVGISTGQKQRILIARAIYKDPQYLFFDEATSALDANNEKVIVENLSKFLKGRTAVIIAHRLSTVKWADNIVVIDNGLVVEQGSHENLLLLKGKYYNLVKNQLELEKLSGESVSLI